MNKKFVYQVGNNKKVKKNNFQIQCRNGIQSKFNAAKGMAVYDWATEFLRCRPGLSIS